MSPRPSKFFIIFVIFAESSAYFLPNIAVPLHYDLYLNVELYPKFQYYGYNIIDINVLNETKSLFIHSNGLKLDETQSYVTNGFGIIKVQSFEVNNTYNIVNITTTDRISAGLNKLVIMFSGAYNEMKKGLFMDYYLDKNGEKRYFLATHFQPTYARNMFPCFDEPNLKATFALNVSHPSDYHAISNTEISYKRYDGSTTMTSFKKTPKMSTYLLAFSVSDFVTLNSYTVPETNTSIHIYVEPKNVQNSKFALNISVSCVTHLQNLLGVNFSLPKLDALSIPNYEQGMENWGLIIYSSSIILNETTTNTERKKFVTYFIAHEIAHQWFGNLVTLNLWDYVWLNEAFATYYSHRISDKIYPNYRFMYNHIVDLHTVLQEDAKITSHSLNHHVTDPDKTMSKFSVISYLKGSAIVRFMSLIFRNYDKAITDYLNENAYKNVVPEDLYNALANQNTGLPRGTTVHSIMKGWTENAGYPLVTVNITSNNNGMAIIVISQKRFLGQEENSISTAKWWIPITLSSEVAPNFENFQPYAWLRDQDESIVLPMSNHSGWLLANMQQAVFCRVNYDEDNWRKIITYLKGPNFTNIHVLNRAQLISDAGVFGKIGLLNQTMVLDLFSYLEQEQDYIPHKASAYGFGIYLEILSDTEAYPLFLKFTKDIQAKSAEKSPPYSHVSIEGVIDKMSERSDKLLPTFDRLAERIALNSKLQSVKRMARASSVISGRSKFNRKGEEITEININEKQEFLNKHYDEVSYWLRKNVLYKNNNNNNK